MGYEQKVVVFQSWCELQSSPDQDPRRCSFRQVRNVELRANILQIFCGLVWFNSNNQQGLMGDDKGLISFVGGCRKYKCKRKYIKIELHSVRGLVGGQDDCFQLLYNYGRYWVTVKGELEETKKKPPRVQPAGVQFFCPDTEEYCIWGTALAHHLNSGPQNVQ